MSSHAMFIHVYSGVQQLIYNIKTLAKDRKLTHHLNHQEILDTLPS